VKNVYITVLSIIAILFLISMILQVAPIIVSISIGLSMFPTIRSGDLLVCVHKNYMPITNDSIASYRNGWSNVVHRVVGIEGDVYVFRGDNNVFDEYIPSSNVVCRVVGIIPMYVWIPVVAFMFSLGVVYITKKSGKYDYGTMSIVIAFMVLTLVIGFSNLALMFTDAYVVKPNPLPVITYIKKSNNTIEIRFSTPLNGYVSCFSSHDTAVSCYIDRTTVVVEDLHDQVLKIVYKPHTPYNISVIYEFGVRV